MPSSPDFCKEGNRFTLKEATEKIDALKINAYSNEQKTGWINKLEGVIQIEVIKTYLTLAKFPVCFPINRYIILGQERLYQA